jgi:hypothetical protein
MMWSVAKDAEIATLRAKTEELEARGGKDVHTSPQKPADAPSKKAAAGGGGTLTVLATPRKGRHLLLMPKAQLLAPHPGPCNYLEWLDGGEANAAT